ncbi:MAG: DNA internalization-related competence protein ComEC/Rec2 [Clostridiales bacterium]|nr:DNA internalization-related competence protein ComEC/Rec2 [Clostridiales bacterium]
MKRPLLWILGVWILGEIVATCFGISLVPETSLDQAMAERSSAIVEIQGEICRFRRTSSGYSYFLDHNTVIIEQTGSEKNFSKNSSRNFSKDSSNQDDSVASEEKERDRKETHQILVYTDDLFPCKIGYRVTVTGELSSFDVPGNPGEFDSNSYYRAQGIDFRLQEKSRMVTEEKVHRIPQLLWELGEAVREKILTILGPKESGLILSVLLGDKSLLDSETKELYQTAGISHILAISGLHVSLFGMALSKLLRKVGSPFWLNGILSGSVVWGYVWLSGASPSSLRAAIMFLTASGAAAVGRTYDLLSALGLSGFLLLMEHPLMLWQGGFQLSFLAMAGVGVLWPAMEKDWEKGGSLGKGLGFSLAIQLTTMPVLAWHFYTIPRYSVFLNLMVVPLAGFLLGLAASGALLSFLAPKLSGLIFLPAQGILLFYERFCKLSSDLPGNTVILGRPKVIQVMAYYLLLGIGVVWIKRKQKEEAAEGETEKNKEICKEKCREIHHEKQKMMEKRPGILRAAGIFPWCVLLVGILQPLPCRQLECTFLDVGQGDSVFVRCPKGSCALIDGGSSTVDQVGEKRILPFLKSQGVRHLDGIFVTHGDADHMNGLLEVIQDEALTVGSLFLSPFSRQDENLEELRRAAEDRGISIRIIKEGDVWNWGNVTWRCLYPSENLSVRRSDSRNDQSLVLSVQQEDFSLLLTGDLEEEGEKILIRNEMLFPVTVLKVGHHGSGNSTCEDFLKKAQPVLAVISCGKDNWYGHPHEETLERLRQSSTEICQTSKQGAVTVIGGNPVRYRVYKEINRKTGIVP